MSFQINGSNEPKKTEKPNPLKALKEAVTKKAEELVKPKLETDNAQVSAGKSHFEAYMPEPPKPAVKPALPKPVLEEEDDLPEFPVLRPTPRPSKGPETAPQSTAAPASAPAPAEEAAAGNAAQGAEVVEGAMESVAKEVATALKETVLAERSGAAKEAEAASASTNAQAPIAQAQEDIFNQLNPPQQEAFKALSSEDRENFCQVYTTVGGTWAPSQQNDYVKAATHSLRLMLENGSLHNVDSNGKTVVDILGDACRQKLAPELKGASVDKGGLMQQLVKQLAYPHGIYQGSGTDTCAPSSIQTIMAATQPGEYARIATELIFNGRATVTDPDGNVATIPLSLSELEVQDNERSRLSKLVQGSLFDYAAQFPAEGEEFAGRGGGGGTFRGEGDGGLTSNQIRELYRTVVGNVPTAVQATDANKDRIVDRVARTLEAGANVPAGLDFDGKGHAVTVVGFDGQNVMYTDPVDMEMKKMPVEEFKQRLRLAILPEQFAAGFNATGNASADDFGGRGGGGGTSR